LDDSKKSLEKPSRYSKDWTQGSVVRNLFLLSWPLMVGAALNQIGPTIDMIWVGRLNSAAIAGVGVAGMASMMMNTVVMAVGQGARAIIARLIGAGDMDGAVHAARQAYLISLIFSLILIPVGLFLSGPILSLFGVGEDVIAEGTIYLQILLVGSVVSVMWMMTESIMQASGDSMSPMKIAIITRVFHVALCPALIFGWWIFPAMGVAGSALSNIIIQAVGLAVGFWILFTGQSRLRMSFNNLRIDPAMIKRIMKIGFPVIVGNAQRSLGDVVMMLLISPFGTVAVAAHMIFQRVMMFSMMPAMGFGTGAAVLAGQNMGANKPARAEKSSWIATGVVQVWMLLFAGAILIWAEELIGIFGPDPDVVLMCAAFCRISAVGFLLFSLEPVLSSVLAGVGDTIPPMLITVGAFWIVQIPLAYVLSKYTGLGIYGVRWGMVFGMLASAIMFAIYFKKGRWKRKNI
jgi:putative MATE family efflux protein